VVIVAFPAAARAGVAPKPVGEIDCNGLSPIQTPVHPTAACADPHGSYEGRFYDNGHYIGHDEPSVRFISNAPGSGFAPFADNISCDDTHSVLGS
jgi:hypothetical protein